VATPPPAVQGTATNNKATWSALSADTGRLSLVELPGSPNRYAAGRYPLSIHGT